MSVSSKSLKSRFLDTRCNAVYVRTQDQWYQMVVQGALNPLFWQRPLLEGDARTVEDVLRYLKAQPLIEPIEPQEQGMMIIDLQNKFMGIWLKDAGNPNVATVNLDRLGYLIEYVHLNGMDLPIEKIMKDLSPWGECDVLSEYIWLQHQWNPQAQRAQKNGQLDAWMHAHIQEQIAQQELTDYLSLGFNCSDTNYKTWSGYMRGSYKNNAHWDAQLCIGANSRREEKVEAFLELIDQKTQLQWDWSALSEYIKENFSNEHVRWFSQLCARHERQWIEKSLQEPKVLTDLGAQKLRL